MNRALTGLVAVALVGCVSETDINNKDGNNGGPAARPIAIASAIDTARKNTPIELDGSPSYDVDDEEFGPLTYFWEVVSSPEGSNYELDDPTAEKPKFSADKLGFYEVALQVTDEDDYESNNPAGNIVEVTPWKDMEVKLTWDVIGIDLDLHVYKAAADYYTDDDCFYGNPEPDWGIIEDITDNPALSTDDEGSGAGETISLDAPEDRTYEVVVHYMNKKESPLAKVTPTVAIYAEGQEVYRKTLKQMDKPETQVLLVGSLDWDTLKLTEKNTLSTHATLGGPPVNE